MAYGRYLWDAPLPDGVYLDLAPEVYFRQECLGSTDLMKLYFAKGGWWWASKYNPDYEEPRDTYRAYGSALHAIVLEGVDIYERRFAVLPDKRDYDGLVETVPEMKAILSEAGFNMRGCSTWGQERFCQEMRLSLPNVPVWPSIKAAFIEDNSDKTIISRSDDRAIRFMHQVAIDPDRTDNADVRHLFDDRYPPLAEVSVFWTSGGIRRRARFDRLFPAFTLDLKSLGNWRGRNLDYFVGEEIPRHGYDIQRADYHFARLAAYRLIADGKVFGGTPEQQALLTALPDMAPTFDWVWLFYQKPDAIAGRAPVLYPSADPLEVTTPSGSKRESDVMIEGRKKRRAALDFYRNEVLAHGLDKPWAQVAELHYTDGYEPKVFLHHSLAANTDDMGADDDEGD